MWRYCEASASTIFTNTYSDSKATRIWSALSGGPMQLREIHDLFNRNASKAEIESALAELGPQIEIETLPGPNGGKLIHWK